MPRPDVRDQRIPQILNAAALVFGQHGIDGSSMNQLAAETGLSKATIYHYFPSKTEIVTSLVSLLFEMDMGSVDELLASQEAALKRMSVYVKKLSDLIQDESHLLPVLVQFKGFATRSVPTQEVLTRYFDGYTDAFEKVLWQGQQKKEVRPNVDPRKAALALVALIEGCILLSTDTGRPLEPTLSESCEVFFSGLEP